MAGFYPDVPGHKMAYDRDGTLVVGYDSAGASKVYSSADLISINGENTATIAHGGGASLGVGAKKTFVFPELRNLAGFFIGTLNQTSHRLETSTDTSNGLDGTWTTAVGSLTPAVYPLDGYRKTITPAAVLGIRGVRFYQLATATPDSLRTVHLYGAVAAATDRLAFWHPTADSEVVPSHGDWGDVARGSSGLQTFRIKNLSATKTATAPRVAMEALNDTTPTVVGQHSVSSDGSTWLSQVTLADLAPGAVSGVLSVRRLTSATAVPSVWHMRLFAEATTWV